MPEARGIIIQVYVNIIICNENYRQNSDGYKWSMSCQQYTTYTIDETMHIWKLPIIENREVTMSQKTIGMENPFAPVVQLFIGRVRYLEI